MAEGDQRSPARRSDAERNRVRVLDAAREVLARPGEAAAGVTGDARDDGPPGAASAVATGVDELSMAEVARRAGVGRATLYRHFPTRRDLLEALFLEEVDAVCAAAAPDGAGATAEDPGRALRTWLLRFAQFSASKRLVAQELLEHTDAADPVFGGSRRRVLAAARPLLVRAQDAGRVRRDVDVEQALDLVLAVTRLDRRPEQVQALLSVALDGLRTTAGKPPP